MNIITHNPFRILGLIGNSSERELQKQIGIIKRYAEIGKTKSFDYDFDFFGDFSRNLDDIQKAASQIEQAHKKLQYSLFWFVNNSSFDEIALNNLKDQNTDKAIEIWNKTLKEEITSKNYSSYLNLSTLYIALSTIDDQIELQKLQAGISLKGNLIHSENLKDFSKLVTGNGIANDPIEISKKFVDEVIELLKPYLNNGIGISTNDLISLFSTFPTSIQKYVSAKFTESPISSIENKIEKVIRKRKDNPRDAEEYAEELYNTTKSDLLKLKKLMGYSNVQFQMLANKVANEILQCSVDYFNERQKNDNDDNFETNLEIAIELAKLADTIAIGDQVKDRVKDNINTLLEMKDREISKAIDFLQSVKDAFETNEEKIRQQVRKMEKTDPDFILGLKSINWIAVEDNIKNSINWKKVNDMLLTILSYNNLRRIKESVNIDLKNNFLELANWLRKDTTKKNSLKSSTISDIIKKYKKIKPMLPFKILSSNIKNTDNKPLYTKFIRHIGLNLNVEVTKDASVTFHLSHINPDGCIERNPNISLGGYTLSKTHKLNINTKSINFSGWSNSDGCTYDVGEHCIEVYVNDYLIHSIKYVVDLAPSEKLEIELKEAEEKLTEIKKTQFFKSELETENFEMSKIQKFQLFRSSTTKQMQISEQQNKIEYIHKKTVVKKEKLIEQQHKIIYKIKSDIKNTDY